MLSFRAVLNIITITAGLFLSALALAHPKLVSSTPAANTAVSALTKIELQFSERLIPKFSGAKLLMTDRHGMSHAPMHIATKVVESTDPKTMALTAAQPLTTGTYKVEWRAVSSDTHPITGSFTFNVK